MADKKPNSDSPWAEISRANLGSKTAKAPDSGSPGAPDSKLTSKADVSAAAATLAAKGKQVEDEPDTSEYAIDDLQEMSLKELQAIAKEAGIDTKGMSKDDLIDALAAEIDEDDSDESDDEEIVLEEDDEESLEAEEIDGEMSLEEALALLGEDGDTEDDFADGELEVVEEEVVEGDATFEQPGNN